MDTQITDGPEEQPATETPEDVAILYSWANLRGAKYRDFSASRREYRAQVRHRAAEALRQAELRAQAEAERAALAAEQVAREAEQAARTAGMQGGAPYTREQALRQADEAARVAAAERVEAARRSEAAAMAEAVARREEREIAEAHVSAQRQATRYAESEIRRREQAGPQPQALIPGQVNDPYVFPQGSTVDGLYTSNNSLDATQPGRQSGVRDVARSGERYAVRPPASESGIRRRPQGYRPDEVSGIRSAFRSSASISGVRPFAPEAPPEAPRRDQPWGSSPDAPPPSADRTTQDPAGPAWLYASEPAAPRPVQSSVADTLQHSRERVAARWFALKGVFEPGQEPVAEAAPVRQKETRTPVLAVFSLAGGVGKTSLVATLGRTLSSLGEKVLLTDTTSQGLLPFYFGASELRPGVVRTFSPPSGSTDAPISLVSYDVDRKGNDAAVEDMFAEEIARNSHGVHRLLFDLNPGSGWVVRRLGRMNRTILVPVAPDMNSVISLQAVEKFFSGTADADGHPIQPFYVLNQFDGSLPLHLDVREVLRRQLGDRLLPFVIRRSPSVSEALAEGMTVVDYAPEAPIAEDYLNIATWLRTLSAPASASFRNVRWSER